MAKYRKKPVVIDATQWFKNGDHPLDYTTGIYAYQYGWSHYVPAEIRRAHDWEGEVVRYYRTPDNDHWRECIHCGHVMNQHGWIDTLEGGHIVCPGDWIITGVEGEMYPCKPNIFAATYDLAVEQEVEHG